MLTSLAAMVVAVSLGGGVDEIRPLQGKWKIVAAFEDGQSLSERDIATQLFADGTINIDGPVISFLGAGAFEPKKVAFTVDARDQPKAIDIVGVTKTGSKGIYLADGDSLMVCLPGLKDASRPRDFGAGQGSGQLLLVFKRANGKNPATANGADPTKRMLQLPPAPTAAAEMHKSLIGTWGHQTDDSINYYTLNADGTFSAVIEWKKAFKRTFSDNVRTSGSWKLENGVIVATVTASTESNMRNQIFSWRITNLGPSDLIAVDGQGRLRHEWRVR